MRGLPMPRAFNLLKQFTRGVVVQARSQAERLGINFKWFANLKAKNMPFEDEC